MAGEELCASAVPPPGKGGDSDLPEVMEEGKDQGRRSELAGGGLLRSLGGVGRRFCHLEGRRRKWSMRGGYWGGGDFVSAILREADQKVRKYLPVREKGSLKDRIIKETCKKEGVWEGELRMGGQARRVSRVRSRSPGA